jgi:hypothetical protein
MYNLQSNLGVAINGKRFVITYKSILSVASKVEDFWSEEIPHQILVMNLWIAHWK